MGLFLAGCQPDVALTRSFLSDAGQVGIAPFSCHSNTFIEGPSAESQRVVSGVERLFTAWTATFSHLISHFPTTLTDSHLPVVKQNWGVSLVWIFTPNYG
jgi:hypothetical protein